MLQDKEAEFKERKDKLFKKEKELYKRDEATK